jgi:hypothetical protein
MENLFSFVLVQKNTSVYDVPGACEPYPCLLTVKFTGHRVTPDHTEAQDYYIFTKLEKIKKFYVAQDVS